MHNELRAANPELNIEILGVNRSDAAALNSLVVPARKLPWLQDTPEAEAWTAWEVTWRDVRILDSQNRLHAVYNLTSHDLANPANYSTLRQMFLDAARVVDTDRDGLADDWEKKYFENLSAEPGEDPDRDGRNNFAEYAFATDPTDPSSHFSMQPLMIQSGAESFLTLKFRRRAGSFVGYRVEASPDLQAWSADPLEVVPSGVPVQHFDGTGALDVAYSLGHPASARSVGFLRLETSKR